MTVISISEEALEVQIPTPEELKEEFPLDDLSLDFISSSRQTINNILNRTDPRLLIVVGPCSLHDTASILEYAEKFVELAEEVSDQFFLVMRAYYEKPRTIRGWKGLLYDPHLDGSHDMSFGLRLTRELLLALTKKNIPLGSELLEPYVTHYFSEFLSWGCIGARTSTSQPHRQMASGLPFPVGFKNTPDGNIDNAIHGILAASSPHTFLGMQSNGLPARVKTRGNEECHIVLRGGDKKPNYDSLSIAQAFEKSEYFGIPQRVLIDCSHDNCKKQHEQQIIVFDAVIEQILHGNHSIVGLMLESHLNAGCQPITPSLRYGVSITDPCLDWKTTEILILKAHQKLQEALTHASRS